MVGWSKHLMNILHFILKNSKTLINKSLSGKIQIINSSKEKSATGIHAKLIQLCKV